MSRGHGNDEGEHVVDERVERLTKGRRKRLILISSGVIDKSMIQHFSEGTATTKYTKY